MMYFVKKVWFLFRILRNNSLLQLQGGMSNEMYNTVARVTDGLYEGIHIFAALFNLIL